MDIWAWVFKTQDELRQKNGHRLAELMDLVPSFTTDNQHARVDSVMPEALALAREAKNIWVEVFLRHWDLQSRVLHRLDVKSALPDAVALLERCSREDAKSCPQSVCVTQDLASCYAYLDGPAYAQERLDVASETLSRINASWPCFTCISGEYAGALLDQGRLGDVVSFVEKQRAELVRAGQSYRKELMSEPLISALIMLGRLDDALDHAERAYESRDDESNLQSRAIDRARILARMDRTAEALKILPPFENILGTKHDYQSWVDAAHQLALRKAIPNDGALHGKLTKLIGDLREHGVARIAFDVAEIQARLALARNKPRSAAKSAAAMREILPLLRTPLDAPEKLAALEQDIAAHQNTAQETFDSPEKVLAALTDDLEDNYERLAPAAALWPTHENLTLALATTEVSLQEQDRAAKLLREFLTHTLSPKVVLLLSHLYRDQNQGEELSALLSELRRRSSDPEIIADCLWPMALFDYNAGEKQRAVTRLEEVLSLAPEAINSRRLLARVRRETGDHSAALETLEPLLQLLPEPGPHDWERIVSATILGRWDVVRHSAARLELPVEPGEGPIDENWGLVRIRFDDYSLRSYELHALRTGPVTALIVETPPPFLPQHFSDELVFDPRPLNDPPPAGEEETHTYIYQCVVVTKTGNYQTHAIDGETLSEEAVEKVRVSLKAEGWRLEVRNDNPFFAYLAAPAATARETIAAKLEGTGLQLEEE